MYLYDKKLCIIVVDLASGSLCALRDMLCSSTYSYTAMEYYNVMELHHAPIFLPYLTLLHELIHCFDIHVCLNLIHLRHTWLEKGWSVVQRTLSVTKQTAVAFRIGIRQLTEKDGLAVPPLLLFVQRSRGR